MSIRLTSDEIDDICYRHCERGEELTTEEIDKLIDTAGAALDLQAELEARLSAANDPNTKHEK